MAPDDLRARLLREASTAGVAVSADRADVMLRYLELVARWRSRARLSAIADPLDAVRLHIADSLLVLRAGLDRAARLIDVGSGAGLPGIPLKIARADLTIMLLEAESRKAAFLELAAHELNIEVGVIRARAEEAAHEEQWREQFDVATARAVAPLPVLCELTLPFVRPGGKVVLLKGPSVRAELTESRAAAAVLGGAEMELIEARLGGGERRVVVVVPKVRTTPPGFPRSPGTPRRRPLGIGASKTRHP